MKKLSPIGIPNLEQKNNFERCPFCYNAFTIYREGFCRSGACSNCNFSFNQVKENYSVYKDNLTIYSTSTIDLIIKFIDYGDNKDYERIKKIKILL